MHNDAASSPAIRFCSRGSASACPVPSGRGSCDCSPGDAGVDPYTRVVSDVYQDLFGEGSFIGKGIYDVDSFEQCCGDFPENAILSHDLIEGAYARSALLSDVSCTRSIRRATRPTSPAGIAGCAATGRLPVGCCPGCAAVRPIRPQSDLCVVAVEDLRQSPPQRGAGGDAAPAARLLVRLAGHGGGLSAVLGERASCFPRCSTRWRTCFASRSICRCACICGKCCSPWDCHFAQFLFTLVFLPYEAYISADAIVRTLLRMAWTKRRCWNGRRPAIRNEVATAAWRLLPLDGLCAGDSPLPHCCRLAFYDPAVLPLRGRCSPRGLSRRWSPGG